MRLGLKDKVAIVAGASSGIGKATAEYLAAEGCHVLLCGRSFPLLKQLKETLGFKYPNNQIEMSCLDVYQANKASQLFQKAKKVWGKIDILVNCASGPKFTATSIEGTSDEQWLEALNGKFLGYIRLSKFALSHMKKDGGRIIQVVGTSGKEPSSALVTAGSINAGLLNYTKALSQEAAKFNVLVTAVNPGYIRTPRFENFIHKTNTIKTHHKKFMDELCQRIPLQRIGNPQEVAALITFLASSQSSYITGAVFNVDGGLTIGAF